MKTELPLVETDFFLKKVKYMQSPLNTWKHYANVGGDNTGKVVAAKLSFR